MDKTEYTYIFYSFDTGDIMRENVARERAITKRPCKECGKTGFFKREDFIEKNHEK